MPAVGGAISYLAPSLISAGGMMGAAAISNSGDDMESASRYTPGQSAFLDQLISLVAPAIWERTPVYEDQRVAGVSPLQQQGFDIYSGYGNVAGEGITALQDAFARYNPDMAQQYQQMGMDALSRVTQQFDPTNITQALEPARELGLRQFKDIIPQIMEHYTAGGDIKSSGAMNRALAQAAKDFSLGFSAQSAPYYIQGYEQNLDRNLAAIPEVYRMGMMPTDIVNQVISGMGSMPMNIASQAINAGGISRGITGEQLGAAQDYWTEQQPWSNPYLQQYAGTILGTLPVENAYVQGGAPAWSYMMPAVGQMLGNYYGNQLTPAGSNVNAYGGYYASPYSNVNAYGGYGAYY